MSIKYRDLSNPGVSKSTIRTEEMRELGKALIDAYTVADKNKNLAEFKALEELSKDSKNFTNLEDFEGAFKLLEEKKDDAQSVHELTSLQAMERLLDNNYSTLNYKNAATESLNTTLSKLDSLGGVRNATSSDVNDIICNLQSLQKEVSSNMYLANDKAFNDQILNQLDFIEITHLLDTHDLDPDRDGWQFDNANFKTAEAYLLKGDYKKARTQLEQGRESEYNQKWTDAGQILKGRTSKTRDTIKDIDKFVVANDKFADKGVFKYAKYVEPWLRDKLTSGDLRKSVGDNSALLESMMADKEIDWTENAEARELKEAFDNKGVEGFRDMLKTRAQGKNRNLTGMMIRNYIKSLGVNWEDTGHLIPKNSETNKLGAELFGDIFITLDGLLDFQGEMYKDEFGNVAF